jgi:transcriptional regulator with XRE-family HTH domain
MRFVLGNICPIYLQKRQIAAISYTMKCYHRKMRGRPTSRPRTVFGEVLASARIDAGLSQQELADRIGTYRSTVKHLERRAVRPKLELVQKCANVLRLPVAQLIGFEPTAGRKKPGLPSAVDRLCDQIRQLPPNRQRRVAELFASQLAKLAEL